jgi:DNA-binding protein H-NS
MSSYKELLEQREKLEKQIEEVKAREFAIVVEEIKQKMSDYGIALADLDNSARVKPGKVRVRSGVAPKYRDPDTGSTWSGRGKPPRWIVGKDREQYLIEK